MPAEHDTDTDHEHEGAREHRRNRGSADSGPRVVRCRKEPRFETTSAEQFEQWVVLEAENEYRVEQDVENDGSDHEVHRRERIPVPTHERHEHGEPEDGD